MWLITAHRETYACYSTKDKRHGFISPAVHPASLRFTVHGVVNAFNVTTSICFPNTLSQGTCTAHTFNGVFIHLYLLNQNATLEGMTEGSLPESKHRALTSTLLYCPLLVALPFNTTRVGYVELGRQGRKIIA